LKPIEIQLNATHFALRRSSIVAAESAKWRVQCKEKWASVDPNRKPWGRDLAPSSFLLLPRVNPRVVFMRRHRYAFSAKRGAFPSTRIARVTDAHMPRDSVKTTRERCWPTSRRRHGTSTRKCGIEKKSYSFRQFARDTSYVIFHENVNFFCSS